MRLIITLFSAYFYLTSILAQQKLDIQTDKAFYVSGEKMGVVVSNSTTNSPEIIYFELLNQSGEILEKLTLKSNGIAAVGMLEIPLNWESDWYVLRTYTVWLPTLVTKDMGYQVIPIYNEFDESPVTENIVLPEIKLPSTTTTFSIQGAKTNYQSGEKVEINIQGNNPDKAQYAVSVIDENTLALNTYFEQLIPAIPRIQVNPAPPGGETLNQSLFLGKIEDESNTALGAFYIAEESKFDFVSFNDENVFGTQLLDFYGEKHAQLVNIEPLGSISYLTPKMFTISEDLPLPKINLQVLPYPKAMVDYLENSRKRRIIKDVFNIKETPNIAEPVAVKPFAKADKSYFPKDYVRFTDTKDFIVEVANLIKLRTVNKQLEMRVLLEKNKLAIHPPVVFLNGFMMTDHEELLTYSLDKIERIDIYRSKKKITPQFGILGRNGVVAIYTKDTSLRPIVGNEIVLQGLFKSNISIRPTISDNLPTLSPQLYWNGQIEPTANGISNFSFGSTNDTGAYYILISQFSEKGRVEMVQKIMLKTKS